MKITAFLILAVMLQVSASSFGQKVSLSEKNAQLEQVLKKIKQQTGYDLLYGDNVLNKDHKVTVNVKNVTLTEALDQVLEDQKLSYSIKERTIIIREKEKSVLEKVKDVTLNLFQGQAIDVRGKVVDSLGIGIGGASVTVKGTKTGTNTAANGDFYLKNVDEGALLVVSYLGYVTKEVKVNKDFNYIQLQMSTSKLDEVQVIAYGVTSQRLSTGNTTVIRAADIEKQPVNNPLYALQGRVAGLQVTPTTGLAGGAVNIQLRGQNSITFVNPPLIVIDGMPIINNIVGLGHEGYRNNSEQQKNQLSYLNFINPNDIESVSILKDAEATSIYGSRGANGVILISTKKGKSGETRIDVDLKRGWSDVSRKMELLNTQQYLELRRDALANSGINVNSSPWNLDIYKKLLTAEVTVWDQSRYTDWQEKLLGGTARLLDFQGAVSGGNSLLKYGLSGNYRKENTVFVGDNSDQKGSVRMSITGASNNQKFQTSLTALFMFNRNTLPGVDFTNLALTLAPNAPSIYTADGNLNWEPLLSGASTWDNPYAQLSKAYEATTKNLQFNGEIRYQFLNKLNFKTQIGFGDLRGNSFYKTDPLAARAPETIDANSPANAEFHNTFSQNLSVEPQITYGLESGWGNINVLLGASYQTTANSDDQILGYGAANDALLRNLASFSDRIVENNSSQYKYAAVFARLNYKWENKYLANFSARRDGSSRFGPGNQFATFGSGALAWIFSEEKFLKRTFPILSYGKARISYGSSGNDGIGDYRYIEKYTAQNATDPYQGKVGYISSGIFNSHYAWEVTRKLEIGLELGFLKDRLLLTTSYYRNQSGNQLQDMQLPTIAGPGNLVRNLPAEIENAGVEFTLETENIKSSSFKWATSFNLSRNTNKLISYEGLDNSPQFDLEIGKQFYGFAYIYNYHGVNPQTGNYEFITADRQIKSNPGDPNDLRNGRNQRIELQPAFYGGMENRIQFKNFSLDILLQFRKQNGQNPLFQFTPSKGNLPIEYADRWRGPGSDSQIGKVFSIIRPTDYNIAYDAMRVSNHAYVDASFIRLKNLSIGYNIPVSFSQKLGVKSSRIYLLGQNLATITKYKGLDPEIGSLTNLPSLRTWLLGINVSL